MMKNQHSSSSPKSTFFPMPSLNRISPLDVDPAVASRCEYFFRTTHLTASEHAGVTLSLPTTMLSITSDSRAHSKLIAQQTVNGDVVRKIERDVVSTKNESKNAYTTLCDVCNVTCNTEKTLKTNREGITHLQNMQKVSVSSVIKQETPPPITNDTLDQEFEKNQDFFQNEASVDSVFVCNTPDLGHNTQKTDTVAQLTEVTEPLCRDQLPNPTSVSTTLIPPSSGTTQKAHDNLNNHRPMRCEVCLVTFRSNKCHERHILGKRHLKNLKSSEKVLPSPSTTPIPSMMTTPINNSKGEVVNPIKGNSEWCELCGIRCSSYEDLNKHISGKKHQKKLKKPELFFGHIPSPEAKTLLQDLRNEEGKAVFAERSKRKANGSMKSDKDEDTKRQKMIDEEKMKEKEGESRVLVTCKVCNVVFSLMAFESHLAGPEHSATALKQVTGVMISGESSTKDCCKIVEMKGAM